ncbi:MAG: YchF/TatD family DNA exonuclease [Nitrospirae bacterium]|nr:YchF/TatD family DNA exonuclease [Nitrospirota bacterium]
MSSSINNRQSSIINRQSFVDTHCHLEMADFDPDRDEVIARARDAEVVAIITIGSDLKGSEGAVRLAREYDFIYAAVGIHPHDAKDYTSDTAEKLRQWSGEKKVVALGETGLDYHYDHSPRDIQREVFERQLALALELNLPVIVHSREAKADTLNILSESGISRGVLHCFSGDMEMAERVMAMGLYVSFAGPVTFKNAKRLQEIAACIPDEYLLIETDAPYLSPAPMRGKRNEPSFLLHTARKLAELRDVGVGDIARITTLNAGRLFGIGGASPEGKIAYKIRDSLYLNITNRCTNACTFCIRFHSDYVKGHNLRLDHEPGIEELKKAIGDPSAYKEVVFCGYGEPLMRLDLVKALARWIKDNGGRVRINTNGQGNLMHGRNILPELQGIVDAISISLDAQDEKTYQTICRPFLKDAYKGVLSFIREAVKYIPDVTVTVVDAPGVDVEMCKKIAKELNVRFRLRQYNLVG